MKRSVVSNHVKCNKHKLGKERLLRKEARERDIASAFEVCQHPRGETLPEEERVYRAKVIWTFLRTATPLSKLTHFRPLLEENALRLSDRRQMTDMVPFIVAQEQQLLKKEISGKFVSTIFDGTTRLGEAMAIVFRYVDDSRVIQQRLICLKMLEKSMTGEEIAQVVIDTLSREYNIPPTCLLACMRDRASVNNVAVRFIKVLYANAFDVGCFSHTLDLVGDKISIPNLSDFMLSWTSLFSHSTKAKILWKDRAIKSYCPTRWWRKWECMKQLLELFGDVDTFVTSNSEFQLQPALSYLQFSMTLKRQHC